MIEVLVEMVEETSRNETETDLTGPHGEQVWMYHGKNQQIGYRCKVASGRKQKQDTIEIFSLPVGGDAMGVLRPPSSTTIKPKAMPWIHANMHLTWRLQFLLSQLYLLFRRSNLICVKNIYIKMC